MVNWDKVGNIEGVKARRPPEWATRPSLGEPRPEGRYPRWPSSGVYAKPTERFSPIRASIAPRVRFTSPTSPARTWRRGAGGVPMAGRWRLDGPDGRPGLLPGVRRFGLSALQRRDGRGRRGVGLGALPGVWGRRRLPPEGRQGGVGAEHPEILMCDHLPGCRDRPACSSGERIQDRLSRRFVFRVALPRSVHQEVRARRRDDPGAARA